MHWQVTVEQSKGLPGWVAKVHPQGVSSRFWVYGVHDPEKDLAKRKALSWCANRSPEVILANLQRKSEAAHAG